MFLNRILRAPVAAFLVALSAVVLPALSFAQAAAPVAGASAADTAAAATAPAATPMVTKETVDNPYGLDALWKQGDMVARGTLIIMVIMSMGSWYIIFTKLFEQSKLLKQANAIGDPFWKAGSMKQAANALADGSAFRYIAEQGVKADEHHEGT